jgi:hypothetical protein
MKDHKNEYKESYRTPKSQLISVVARPLMLILQEDFWGGLMQSYFKYFHPCRPLFNLVNFDPKKASESLLSAIYFAGFVTQPNPPDEICSYMQNYAIYSIKKMIYTVNLSAAQALGIYSYAFYLNGNSSLTRVCLSHFGRVCHALGISINRKKLPILDQYNRNLAYNIVKLHYNSAKLQTSPYGLASQEDEFDLDLYEPVYHFPNSCLNIYNNYYENAAYSVFCCQFAKINNLCAAINSKFAKYKAEIIKKEIKSFNRITNKIYNDAKISLESLINLAPEYKNKILACLLFIKAPFIICTLSIYTKMLEISDNKNLKIIQAILDKCIELYEIISNDKNMINIWSWGLYVVSFHLIQVYSYCSKKQKQTILFILRSIINLYYEEGFNRNSTNFLVLSTQFEIINSY